MGIPAFFQKCVKSYPAAFVNIKTVTHTETIDTLYMDSNSVIYDVVNEMSEHGQTDIPDTPETELQIFSHSAKRIEDYILSVKPNSEVYIAFDGIAPIAKMEQQRCRRYRGTIISGMETSPEPATKSAINKFSITSITPGTGFMKRFASFVDNYFRVLKVYTGRNKLLEIHVSTSEFIGEGEHKIFNHVRKAGNYAKTLAVYGLDADLIVLSLFNLSYCDNMFLIRDPVDYTNSENKNPYSDSMVCIDMNILAKTISTEIRGSRKTRDPALGELRSEADMDVVYDYLFLCFLLGNDFIPHSPVVNVRTNGMQILKDLYGVHICPYKDRRLVKDGDIEWKWVSLIIDELKKIERTVLLKEYKTRDGIEKSVMRGDKKDDVNNIPILSRTAERYINPADAGWENRYYKSLFGMMDDRAISGCLTGD
jgi:5'-3' exonuclease